jgi:hypothetical protein
MPQKLLYQLRLHICYKQVCHNLRFHSYEKYLFFFCQQSLLVTFFITMAQQPLVVQSLLIIETSRSHTHTPHSVGLLSTSDQPDADTST